MWCGFDQKIGLKGVRHCGIIDICYIQLKLKLTPRVAPIAQIGATTANKQQQKQQLTLSAQHKENGKKMMSVSTDNAISM